MYIYKCFWCPTLHENPLPFTTLTKGTTFVVTMVETAAKDVKSTGSTHPNRVRMLVLETDQTFKDTVKRKGGTFGQILHDLFEEAGRRNDPPLEIETVMKFVVEAEGGKIPELDDLGNIHAILLTGSKYDAHGNDAWIVKLVEWIQSKCHTALQHIRAVVTINSGVWREKPHVRFSGVCFGHQGMLYRGAELVCGCSFHTLISE